MSQAPHWDDNTLRTMIASTLAHDQIIVVSDREPFSHARVAGQLQVTQPASGLVTAVEPVVRACGGTWVAHGSGSADREVVDHSDAWHVPADVGGYRLRRVWLSDEEVRAYRDGFANTGLWPVCHRTKVRPVFNEADWHQYQSVNRRFAQAVVEEARQPNPIVLVHDYHLALVPAMVRERLPRATIISFWHIPWTSPERMAWCPWLPALMDGLLASDIVGLQTRAHRKNFVASAERCGPSVVSADRRCVVAGGRRTRVHCYPISIAWPSAVGQARAAASVRVARSGAARRWSLPLGGKLVIGIDRFDYTKGLVERLHAIEYLLDAKPQWRGRLRFVQVAAPSRTTLPDYAAFRARVFGEAARINERFAATGFAPIVLLDAHCDRPAIDSLYRAADLCLVTSLDDGMNLVCKEFVAAREDEQGVLVLSEFAGAASELSDALIVNPHHTAQVAGALHRGLAMPAAEQGQRMKSLRAMVRFHNVYRWAANMLLDAARLRHPIGIRAALPADTVFRATPDSRAAA